MNHQMSLKVKLLPNASVLGRIAAMAFAGVTMAGCASLVHRTPEEAVQYRATQRWQAMQKKDFKTAYRFLSPFKRSSTSESAYLREMGDGSAWLSTEVVSVSCEPQNCKTRVRLEVASPLPRKFGDKITTHIDEDWVLVDGEWWYSQR